MKNWTFNGVDQMFVAKYVTEHEWVCDLLKIDECAAD